MSSFSLRVSDELSRKMKAFSKLKDRTIVNIAIEAIEAYLAPYHPQIKEYEESIKAQFKDWHGRE